jgi:hypothetical protein
MLPENASPSRNVARRRKRVTKKQQILALYLSGNKNIEDLATITNARASYVSSVLQNAGLIHGYFDLYTSTGYPMNLYSKLFAGKLGFKDESAARRSVAILDQVYGRFARAGDRPGQHHALYMALVMFDRARWTGRGREAELFRRWLVAHLMRASSSADEDAATTTASKPRKDKDKPKGRRTGKSDPESPPRPSSIG